MICSVHVSRSIKMLNLEGGVEEGRQVDIEKHSHVSVPAWLGDGGNLGGPPLNALATVEAWPFNGTLPKWSVHSSSVHFSAQTCINLLLPSLIADLTQKTTSLPRGFALWIEILTSGVKEWGGDRREEGSLLYLPFFLMLPVWLWFCFVTLVCIGRYFT